MNRRRFLQLMTLSATTLCFPAKIFSSAFQFSSSRLICDEKFQYATTHQLSQQPIGNVVAAIGKTFINTPYKANTLETGSEETLIINLEGVDCVTLYEYSLAFARCIKKNKLTYTAFEKEVEFLRYRDGLLNGYASRLHYTSDYFYNNEEKGVLKNITHSLGGILYKKRIHFMTTHREKYLRLVNDETFNKMKNIEEQLSTRSLCHIPKEKIQSIENKIHDGDIIGITTTIDGLDCKHTAIAVRVDKELRMLHAPRPGSHVQITEQPLWQYLSNNKTNAGIMVARPLEVT